MPSWLITNKDFPYLIFKEILNEFRPNKEITETNTDADKFNMLVSHYYLEENLRI